MTSTYTLRSASPAKTRTDAVVVGVLKTDKGPVLADGGEDVAAAFGRKLRPMLASLGVSGKSGESVKIPTAGTLNAPLLVLVGLGTETDVVSVRRAAGVAARSVPNASSLALALPAGDASLVAAALQGYLLGGYTFTRYKKDAKDDRPAEVVLLSPVARDTAAITAFEEAQVVAAAVAATRDWVNEPPGNLTPPLFADAVTAAHKAATKGRGAPRSPCRSSRRTSSRSWAAAGSSAWAAARTRRRGWSGWSTPPRPPAPTWPWSARASPSTPAG